MNNKRIDNVIGAAFGEAHVGELNAAEKAEFAKAQALRKGLASLKDVPPHQLSNERLRDALLASMTPAQRAEFDAGQKVSAGLKALRDVPQHQLSNERLRDAILGTVASRRRHGWAYATATLACIAVALVAVRNLGPAEPSPAHNDTPFVASGLDGSTAPDERQSAVRPAAQPTPVERPAQRNPRSRVVANGPAYHELADPSNFEDIVRNISFDVAEDVAAPAGMEAAAPSTDRTALVVVDSASTTPNGAAKATELSSYGDVVFGG
jgi:hypothetical protein